MTLLYLLPTYSLLSNDIALFTPYIPCYPMTLLYLLPTFPVIQ